MKNERKISDPVIRECGCPQIVRYSSCRYHPQLWMLLGRRESCAVPSFRYGPHALYTLLSIGTVVRYAPSPSTLDGTDYSNPYSSVGLSMFCASYRHQRPAHTNHGIFVNIGVQTRSHWPIFVILCKITSTSFLTWNRFISSVREVLRNESERRFKCHKKPEC